MGSCQNYSPYVEPYTLLLLIQHPVFGRVFTSTHITFLKKPLRSLEAAEDALRRMEARGLEVLFWQISLIVLV